MMIECDRMMIPCEGAVSPSSASARRALTIEKRYLNLPVKFGAEKVKVRLLDEESGKLLRRFIIELSEDAPEFWASYDVSSFIGRSIKIEPSVGNFEQRFINAIRQSDEPMELQGLYEERYRPQFHFSTRRGCLNDPNGLFIYAGKYHLFHQHNPFSWGHWGNMHWGHAVSKDLVHWQELNDVLYPDEHGTCWSGSAVVDWKNTSGLQQAGKHPPILLFYTAGGEYGTTQPCTQCIAFSTDGGQHFQKYAGNPVLGTITEQNRDPRVIWHEPSQHWVMVLYLKGNEFALLISRNLIKWEVSQRLSIEGGAECPELLELPVDGEPAHRHWILMAGNSRYLIGRFDGRTFSPESGPYQFLNQDGTGYLHAVQCWTNAPEGRQVMIAWQQIDLWGMPFNSCISIPVELKLRRFGEQLRLCVNPINELVSLVQREYVFSGDAEELPKYLWNIQAELLDIEADVWTGELACLCVRGIDIILDPARRQIRCQGAIIDVTDAIGRFQLRVLVDRASIEIFTDKGRQWLGVGVGVAVIPENRRCKAKGITGVNRFIVRELRSIWGQHKLNDS